MRMRLRIDLKKIQSEYGIPMLMITHNPVEAYTMADRLIVYSHGRVEQIGSPKEIFNKPKNRDIASLVGMNNIFKGVVLDVKEEEVLIQSQEKITALKISGLEIGEEIIWCIRPDQVMVLREDKYLGKAVAENLFSGKIIEVIPNGTSYLLFLEGALNLETEIPAHAFERLNLMVGKIIRVSLKKSAIHIIKEKE
jgi:molybdate transport system ATP-binding protein